MVFTKNMKLELYLDIRTVRMSTVKLYLLQLSKEVDIKFQN